MNQPHPKASNETYAQFYAAQGFLVVPFHRVWPNGNCTCKLAEECPKPGKHPRVKDWKEKATTDSEVISEWWSGDWIYSNVTLLTGVGSRLVVLDFDGKEGLATHAALERKFGPLPTTPASRSGGGGLHVWFRHPGKGVYVPSGDGILGPHADVKADGGSITVPPSNHASGGRYEWTRHVLADAHAPPGSGDYVHLAELPSWVLEQLDQARETGVTAVSATDAGAEHSFRRRRSFSGKAYQLPSAILSGGRSDELYSYGCSLRARGGNELEIEEALERANAQICNPPLDHREVQAIIKSCLKHQQGERRGDPTQPRRQSESPRPPEGNDWWDGLSSTRPETTDPEPYEPREPGDVTEPPQDWFAGGGGAGPPGGGSPPSGGGGSPPRPTQPVILAGPDGIPMTDLGNAERLYRDQGTDLRYVGVTKRWYAWTGLRWQHDQRNKVKRLSAMTSRRMHLVIGDCRDEAHQKQWRAHVKTSESARGLLNTMDCLAMHREVARDTADLDAGTEDLLNTPSGTLNLRTLVLGPHVRDPMITKITRMKYDADAECPQWMRFLMQIMDNDADMVAFLQRAVGYALTGHTTEHCLFFLHGQGRNGKSTFIETVRHMIGDYGRVADFSTFLDRPNDTMRNDLAALRGARMVTAGEPDQGKRFSEGIVKSMTGGDVISCRHLYGDFFEYAPEYKIFLAANYKPTVRGQDEGIWRRFRLVPFDVQISEEKKDLKLAEKLRAEWPGILAWAAQGARDWYQGGLQAPKKVLAATAEYRDEMDAIGQFVRESFEVGEHLSGVPASQVYETYTAWCKSHGEYVVAHRRLSRLLKERGYETEKRGGRRVYPNWGLKAKPSSDNDQQPE